MIEDLTMIANQPVADMDAAAQAKADADAQAEAEVAADAQTEADKAAASETMPPAKHTDKDEADVAASEADRVARRGQDPPEQEKTGEEDS